MPTTDDAKAMAKRLRTALAARDITLSHSETLELVAAQLGHADWNTAAARLERPPTGGIALHRAIPVLRSFDEAKAREFYCDFLGFTVLFQHRFHPSMPLYLGIARAGLELHLSEHHGDASPGATVFVPMRDIRALHAELLAKKYRHNRPGIEEAEWGLELQVHDPFGNRIRFCEMKDRPVDPATG